MIARQPWTPLPWRVVVDMNHAGNRRIAGTSFSAVAKVYGDEPTALDEKGERNAAYIVWSANNAPSLLEALQELLAELVWVNKQLDLMPDDYAEAQSKAARAVAQALGGTHA